MTFKELQDAVYSDLSATSSDSFFTLTIIKSFINRAIKRVGGLYPWPHTLSSETRDSEAGQEYYNYPEDWYQNSIYRVEYNGDKYLPTDFEDYEDYKKENDTREKRFANFENKYFITPTPASDIVNGISLWGQKIPAALVNDGDINPFAEDPEIEEEIVNLVLAACMKKQRGSYLATGRQLELDTLSRITSIWKKVYMKKAKFMTRTRSMFNPIDVLGQPSTKSIGNTPGNFNYPW